MFKITESARVKVGFKLGSEWLKKEKSLLSSHYSSLTPFNNYLLNIYYSSMLCIWAKMVKDGTVTVLKKLKYNFETTRPGISECSMKILEDLIIAQQGGGVGREKEIRQASGKSH